MTQKHIKQPLAQLFFISPNIFSSDLSFAHMFHNCGNHKTITLQQQASNRVLLEGSVQPWVVVGLVLKNLWPDNEAGRKEPYL